MDISPERWQKIEQLYHTALEREPGGRSAFLDQACQGDVELRREVEALLAQGDAAGDSTVTILTPGAQLGPYQIEAAIGAGGMGSVYRAVDTRLGRKVAIKICAQQFSGRFEREARAISSLNHPHICTLYDVGPKYLVMELVEGETLAARLQKGRLPMAAVVRYAAEIADALAAAHALGIIHRDLKPQNIMITKSGVKVLDFGLAKSPRDETLTATRVVMGTPAYMAPEQMEGKECDARSDIYALGLVLYEMAAGKRLLRRQPPLTDGLPPQLAHVIERCVAIEPESRWHSATDVKFELEWAGKTQPTAAPVPADARQQVRTRLLPVVAAALAVVSIALGVLFWRATRPLDRPLMRFSADLGPEAMEGGMITAVISPDGGLDLWALPLDMSDPEHPKPGKAEPFLRTEFDEQEPAFSPDGRWIAYTSNESGRNEVYVRPFPSGAPSGSGKWQISTGGGRYPIWSRNGRELFYETLDDHIMVAAYTAKADSFAPDKPRPWSNAQIREPAGIWNLDLAPDGKRFAVFLRSEAASEQKGSVHMTVLLNFFDELRRRVPAGK